MAQELKYYPDGRTVTVDSETPDEKSAREASANVNTSTAGLAAKLGKSAKPSAVDPDEPTPPPSGSGLSAIAAFAEAKRRYQAKKAAQAAQPASTPKP